MHSTGEHHHRDEDGPEQSPPAETRPGLTGWVLVVAAAVPVVLMLEGSRQFFSGALDDRYFGYYGTGEELVDRVVPFVERWYAFQYAVPTTPALLASTLGVVVVTGLVLLGRPRQLVPSAAARWVAFAVAVLTAVAAALFLVAALLAVSEEPEVDESNGSSSTYVSFPEISGPVGVSLLTGVVSGLAASVLARPPAGRRPRAGDDVGDGPDLHAAPTGRATPAGDLVPDRVPDVVVPHLVPDVVPDVVPDLVPDHERADGRVEAGPRPLAYPRADDADLDLYRRH